GFFYQGEAFLALSTQQNFTTPFYALFNPTTTDHITLMSADGSVPSMAGFTNQGNIGYAYDSPVCGSVQLLGAFKQVAGSHYYTTDPVVHSDLISRGTWINSDSGAFVLPLPFVWYVSFIFFYVCHSMGYLRLEFVYCP
ncbi:hypothetical protein BDN70DRAFT_802536, partial [Pholiota conissans]